MEIKIYGAEGCLKCSNLKQKTKEVVEELELDAEVEKIEDVTALAEKGLMSTPGFEIDDKIIFQGSNPPKDEIKQVIEEHKE